MITIVFITLFTLLGLTFIIWRKNMARAMDEVDNPIFGIIGSGCLVIAALTFVLNAYTIVPYGHVAVLSLFGEVDNTELGDGFHFPINPMCKVEEYNIQIRTISKSYVTETIDTQTVTIPVVMNIQPNSTLVSENFRRIGSGYIDVILDRAAQEAVRGEIAKHKIVDLVKERPNARQHVEESLRKDLGEYGIELKEITFGTFDFSDQYDDAIEKKQLEEQRAEQRKYELLQRQTEASMAEAKARGEAEAAIQAARGRAESVKLEAEAEANALRIRADAQADYNRKVSESLTGLLVQRQYVDKWNGTLPTYMLGNSSTSMLIPLPEHK